MATKRSLKKPVASAAPTGAQPQEDEGRPPDHLVPDPLVAQEFSISLMSLWRWTRNPRLGFPAPVKINGRNFRSRQALEGFKRRMLADAVARRKVG